MLQAPIAGPQTQPYVLDPAYCENGIFWTKPYIQLGPRWPDEGFEVNWFSCFKRQYWQVEYRQSGSASWKPVSVRKADSHRLYRLPLNHLSACLSLQDAGEIEYRLLLNRCVVFGSRLKMPSGRIAVFGDFADGQEGCRKIAASIHSVDPSLMVIVGDITYPRGWVCEYRDKLFPVANASVCDPGIGAPLLCSRASSLGIGNHDVGATEHDGDSPVNEPRGQQHGYFIFARNPDNGPRLSRKAVQQRVSPRKEGRALLKQYGPGFVGKTNFSFGWRNTFWIMLDANKYMSWTSAKLRRWLLTRLKSSGADWKFVTFHQPGFNDDKVYWSQQKMRLIADILQEGGVDMVFSGHCHFYQRHRPLRFKPHTATPLENGTVPGELTIDTEFDGIGKTSPRGIIYLVTGIAGKVATDGLWGPLAEVSDTSYKIVNDVHSFTCLDVEGRKLTVRQISSDGREVDRFVVEKHSPVPVSLVGELDSGVAKRVKAGSKLWSDHD